MLSPTRLRTPVGIDLGTTNSVIALVDDAGALVTGRDEQGQTTFPSLAGHHPQRGILAGREARALPNDVLPLASVKRFMGLDRLFPLGPESLSAVDVSAVILRHLRERMARTVPDPRQTIDRAIITMPAYFNHNQIEATRQAGERAGLEVLELLHEPTAAAIYYSWVEQHGDAVYLVYDLGGGTFDVSIIRRRLDDYEVLAVSGDPFLGGDDFDRLLASHLVAVGQWKWNNEPARVPDLFDPATPHGAIPFARFVRLAESIKSELTTSEDVTRSIPRVLADEQGRELSLEISVNRSTFQRLIRDKVQRSIDCCHEALAQARDRAGIELRDIDHIILVGGSSRVPLVRDLVRTAFANPQLPERVRNLDILMHEPDLCVAYGAALRAAGHGTQYLFGDHVRLHLTGSALAREVSYPASGMVMPEAEGASVRIRSLKTGLVEEVFCDHRGAFTREIDLEPEVDNDLEWTLCDAAGRDCARVVTTVRHRASGRPLGQGMLPTQLITKPLSIEVLGRGRQRIKQVVAPVGAALPGTFTCTCRTSDQSGRIVVPIFEENRVIKQLVIDDLPKTLPIGSPVDVRFSIDVTHTIEVHLRLRQGEIERRESATIEAPPAPTRPTRGEIDETWKRLEEELQSLTGSLRSRLKQRASQVREDLLEALLYDDEPRAIQRMAELKELMQQAEVARTEMLDPPWPRFAQLVRACLDLAAEVTAQTGRNREELIEHIHTQERYAEKAYEDHNQPLYRECRENLEKYAGYLNQLLRDNLPRPSHRPTLPPEEEAKQEVEAFRQFLTSVWKQVRAGGRKDLDTRMTEIARQAAGWTARVKSEPVAVIRDARRLGTEIEKVREQLGEKEKPPDEQGLLEGSTGGG